MKKKYIEKLINIEVILYLFFGVIATILNIVLFYLFVIEWKMSISLGNTRYYYMCPFSIFYQSNLGIQK